MQHDSNLQTAQAETSVSNAVLTPEQIHPNYFKMKKSLSHINQKNKPTFKDSAPLSTYDVEHRKRLALRQMSVIANMPSTAVLGA